MKKILLLLIIIISFGLNSAFAQKNIVTLYLFWGSGCPHCEKEQEFLPQLQEKYGDNLRIQQFEIWNSKKNRSLLQEVAKQFDSPANGVPITLIGDAKILGYGNDTTTGKQIDQAIEYCIDNLCNDRVKSTLDKKVSTEAEKSISSNGNVNTQVSVPFFGSIQLKDFSLPVVTIILGALDGFNPCAMWILLFLISMLIGMKDKRKMWIIGFTFIGISAFSYFLFITAWLQMILFLGFVVWIRGAIGVFALAGGGWNLYSYFRSSDSGCEIVSTTKRQKIITQVKHIIHEKTLILALLGVSVLAFSVNLIELLCSAGLPVIFTQMLILNDVGSIQRYLYILLYIFFFMIDDIIVFVISMITLEAFGITTKYTKYSHLIGGVLMIIIGFLLIFRPELLMFG